MLFYLDFNADRELTIEALARELQQEMLSAQYEPSEFHIAHQLLTLDNCMEQYGSNELSERLKNLVAQLPHLMP